MGNANPIALDLTRDLPAMRAAFDAREVQIFQDTNECQYRGPCIIGTVMPVERRGEFDRATIIDPAIMDVDVWSLLEAGWFTAPESQWRDIQSLQHAHDQADEAKLGRLLTEYEEKYL